MEKIHGNMHVFVLLCKFLTCKHKDMRVASGSSSGNVYLTLNTKH